MSASVLDDRLMTTLVVDDHTLFRKGLVNLLEQRGITVLGEASDGRAGIEQAVKLNPDLILMDVNMPACNGIEATRAIHERMPDARVLMLTMSDEEADLFSSVKAGAKGYVLKTADVDALLGAIDRVMKGEAVIPPHMASRFLDEFAAMAKGHVSQRPGASQGLTKREEEILGQLVSGSSNKEIGNTLDVSEHTVKIHLKNILKKLHLSNRTQAAIYAQRHGLVAAASPLN